MYPIAANGRNVRTLIMWGKVDNFEYGNFNIKLGTTEISISTLF